MHAKWETQGVWQVGDEVKNWADRRRIVSGSSLFFAENNLI
jgi:hypothetical protein